MVHLPAPPNRFATWLNATLHSRGLTQADLARVVGVADAQVSRWRRGQVVPSVHYLQRMADAFGVARVTLDRLAGYPVEDALRAPTTEQASAGLDVEREAELIACEARLGQALRTRVPRELWRVYAEACEALAEAMGRSFQQATGEPSPGGSEEPRSMGFGGRRTEDGGRRTEDGGRRAEGGGGEGRAV